MTRAFSFYSSLYFVWFLCSTTSKKKRRIVSNGKERETERERKNGQLLLFDGQSTDDKDYAIVFSMIVLV